MALVSLCCGTNMNDAISTGKISSAKILSSASCLHYAFFFSVEMTSFMFLIASQHRDS